MINVEMNVFEETALETQGTLKMKVSVESHKLIYSDVCQVWAGTGAVDSWAVGMAATRLHLWDFSTCGGKEQTIFVLTSNNAERLKW